jgi:hypothetical protein
MAMNLGPSGLTGAGTIDDFRNIYDNTTFNLTTSAQTIFQQSTGDGSYPAVSLSTGTYLVRVYVDRYGSGVWYDAYWSGIMHWFGGGTNSGNTSNITLHGSAHAFNNGILYARTVMTGGNYNNLRFQIWTNSSGVNASCRITVAVRRLA